MLLDKREHLIRIILFILRKKKLKNNILEELLKTKTELYF